MTVFTWSAGDGTSTADWTGPANWDQGASYPQTGDTAIFPSGKHKCYVNAVSTCATVTINGDAADTVLELQAALEVTGDLTITSGIMDLGATQDLTVGGKTIIGDASHGSEDQATLTCNASAISLGSGKTDDYAIEMLAGGTFAGGAANHTTGPIKQTAANTKFTFTSATTTINSEYTSEDRMFELTAGKAYNADGRITLTGNFTSCIQWTGPTGDTGPHTLRLNDASLTVKPRNTLYVEENLNIDAGTFNTQYDGSDKDLTVTGQINIASGGTLTLNGSTVTSVDYFSNAGIANMDSATVSAGGLLTRTGGVSNLTTDVLTLTNESGSYVMTDDGTYHHNSGTVHIDWNTGGTNGTTVMDMNTSRLYNLIIEMNSSSYETKWYNKLQVDNDLTINKGRCVADVSSPDSATISGSLIIDNEGTFGATGTNETVTIGNLFMKSGSTLVLASGTTTVTANGSNATGRTWFTRTNSTDPGPRTLTVPSGSMLMLPNGGTMEFDNSNYFYNITCSGTFDTKNSELHIDNNFRCNGWGPNGYAGYWFTVGNDFTKIGASTFNAIDTGSTWTVSGNMTIEDGTIDVHGRSAPTPGDVNLKLYGNFINNGGYII